LIGGDKIEMDKEQLLKESWFRCYELDERKRKNNKLIETFNKQASILAKKYLLSESVFLLIDSYGILIAGFDNTSNKILANHIGAYFTEESCGTNAISLAIKLKDEVILKADEHYCYLFEN